MKQYSKVVFDRREGRLFEFFYQKGREGRILREVTGRELSIWREDREGEYRFLLDEEKRLKKLKLTPSDLQAIVAAVKRGDIDSSEIYGYYRPENCFIATNYSDMKKFTPLKICYLDIETGFADSKLDSSNNIILDGALFPNVQKANFPILTITLFFQKGEQLRRVALGLKKYTGSYDIEYHHCRNELELLKKFQRIVMEEDPDIVTGWNSSTFDYPALFNRMKRRGILPESMSRLHITERKSFPDPINSDMTYEYFLPVDYTFLDFLELYRRFVFTKRESYALNAIAEVELGDKKLEYDGNLMDLYNRDYNYFLEYNIQDVELLYRLEKKLKLHLQVETLAYDMACNFKDMLGTVVPWSSYIYKQCYKEKLVLPSDRIVREDIEKYKLKGGHVECRQGFYKGVISYDFSSLYPSIQISWNISIDSMIPEEKLPEELKELRKEFCREENIDFILQKSEEDLERMSSILKKYNVTMTPNGCFYRRDREGIMPKLLSGILQERKSFKKVELKLESLLQQIEVNESAREDIELTEQDMIELSIEELKSLFSRMKPERYRIEEKRVISFKEQCHIFQLIKKVQANSCYGYNANEYALLSSLDIAKSITSSARFMARYVQKNCSRKFIEKYSFDPYIYTDTDSVTADTIVAGRPIEELYREAEGEEYTLDKYKYVKRVNSSLSVKTFEDGNVVDRPVSYIMKHKVDKKLYRIRVGDRSVVVTEDHSIMVYRNEELISIRPSEIQPGDKAVVVN